MKQNRVESNNLMDSDSNTTESPFDFTTPHDDIFPEVQDSVAQFYLDLMRLYLGIYYGTISLEQAVKVVEILKQNPEYTKNPSNPTLVPIKEEYKTRIIENIRTLSKYNLVTTDAVRSAYRFAFLLPDKPIEATDLKTLRYILDSPLESLHEISKQIGVTPRTVSRSLERLKKNHALRFSALVDTTSFGIQSIILFFTLKQNVDWSELVDGIAEFPFTKAILKTSMSDLGNISFLIPGDSYNVTRFLDSLAGSTQDFFDYFSIHLQQATGVQFNIKLFNGTNWVFTDDLETYLLKDKLPESESFPRLLRCQGFRKGLAKEDFIVASKLIINSRVSPSRMSETLRMSGWNLESKQISRSIRKLTKHNCINPFSRFGGLNLGSNFCFEIVCDENWRNKILLSMKFLPSATYYVSHRGIIVWMETHGDHQVEYYKIFRSLEKMDGVFSVRPIMTISHSGSRSMLDLVRNWNYGASGWTVNPDKLDLSPYINRD